MQQNAFHSALTAEEVELLFYFRTMSKASSADLMVIAEAMSEQFPNVPPVIRLVKPA